MWLRRHHRRHANSSPRPRRGRRTPRRLRAKVGRGRQARRGRPRQRFREHRSAGALPLTPRKALHDSSGRRDRRAICRRGPRNLRAGTGHRSLY
ncbi:MAG: hypothetical protein DMD96_00405 [Candidatus Rokuibacteriota bacterium]|nr:MAG: hypothetical protein DMD96_00405 [Candidatus Rokubacteria bacterium]